MRTQNWPTKLALFIEEKRHQPFNWQENNCGFFVCDWLAILVGVDPAAEPRKLTGKELVKAVRAKPLEERAAEIALSYQWPQVPVAFAQRGDVVAIELPGIGFSLGVCAGPMSVFPGQDGIVFNPTPSCVQAWRIS